MTRLALALGGDEGGRLFFGQHGGDAIEAVRTAGPDRGFPVISPELEIDVVQ